MLLQVRQSMSSSNIGMEYILSEVSYESSNTSRQGGFARY